MKIIADNKIPFLRGALEPYADVVYLPGKETTAEVVRDADAMITRTRTRCDASLLEGSSVKVIATATIGFDHIDTAWCVEHGIIWRNAPGCNSWSVKQYITALLVTLARKRGFKLSEMTLGVVGVGNVGSKVAEAASILGMKVLLNDPPRERAEGPGAFVTLDYLIAHSDIITLHVPLQKEGPDATWHLFDAERIAQLRPSQILINSSRGPVVDCKALKAALQSRSIAGACLDVWEGEPELDPELVDLLDISTPHIAGYPAADGLDRRRHPRSGAEPVLRDRRRGQIPPGRAHGGRPAHLRHLRRQRCPACRTRRFRAPSRGLSYPQGVHVFHAIPERRDRRNGRQIIKIRI